MWQLQEKTYVYISLGGRHQNTSPNTADARSPEWNDTLTFEHPGSEHSDLSVAIYAKHTLLPDTLIGSAGMWSDRQCLLTYIVLSTETNAVTCRLSSAPHYFWRAGQNPHH